MIAATSAPVVSSTVCAPSQIGGRPPYVLSHPEAILHHGDAIGADAEVHDIAVELGCEIVIHPPTNETQRAFKSATEIRAPKPYLDRNKEIVCATSLQIAGIGRPIHLLAP